MWRDIPTKQSPWGVVDYSRQLGEDIWIASTPGHGGLYVGTESYGHIPIGVRRSLRGARWFEEDLELTIALAFLWERCDLRALEKAFVDNASRAAFIESSELIANRFDEYAGCLEYLRALKDKLS